MKEGLSVANELDILKQPDIVNRGYISQYIVINRGQGGREDAYLTHNNAYTIIQLQINSDNITSWVLIDDQTILATSRSLP